MNVRTVISVLGLVLISTNAFASKGVQNQERHSLTQPLKDAVGPKVAEYIPNISVVLDVGFGATFGSKQLITDGSMGPNGFSLLCADLEIEGHVDRFFRYAFLFDFAGLEIEEAYIATTALPIGMQIRTGYMFVPFGRQNPRHIHNWNFINQTLTQTRFMGEGKFAALGAELLFDLPLPWEMQISGQILDAHELLTFTQAPLPLSSKLMPASSMAWKTLFIQPEFLMVLTLERILSFVGTVWCLGAKSIQRGWSFRLVRYRVAFKLDSNAKKSCCRYDSRVFD